MECSRLERSLYEPQKHTIQVEVFEQWHKLNSAHMRGLLKLAEAVESAFRPVTRYEAGIGNDGSEYGNFAALAWWDLIESRPGERWSVTNRGWEFLAMRRSVSKYVLTYPKALWPTLGVVKGFSVELVNARDAIREEVWKRPDYVGFRHQHVPRGALVV